MAQSQAIKQRWVILEGRALKAYGAAQRQLKQLEKAKESLTRSLHTFRQQSAFDHECSALSELIQLNLELDNLSALTIYGEDIWKLLHSGKLDCTNAEPTKAWWACYSAFQRIDDPRAAVALRTVRDLFLKQLASIEDERWKDNFSNQIVEHRMLLQSLR